MLALKSIVFSRTDLHFARPILFHLIGEASGMAENADFAEKCGLFDASTNGLVNNPGPKTPHAPIGRDQSRQRQT